MKYLNLAFILFLAFKPFDSFGAFGICDIWKNLFTNNPTRITVLSSSAEVREVGKVVESKVAKINPQLFSPTTCDNSLGQCANNTLALQEALIAIKMPNYRILSTAGHYSMRAGKEGNVIVDPSIMQFIDHPDMQGVFVGTAQDLADFILANPNSLINTGSNGDPFLALKKIWGIEILNSSDGKRVVYDPYAHANSRPKMSKLATSLVNNEWILVDHLDEGEGKYYHRYLERALNEIDSNFQQISIELSSLNLSDRLFLQEKKRELLKIFKKVQDTYSDSNSLIAPMIDKFKVLLESFPS